MSYQLAMSLSSKTQTNRTGAVCMREAFLISTPDAFLKFVNIPCLAFSVSLWLSLSPDRLIPDVQDIHPGFQIAINRITRSADNRLVLVE